MEVNKPRFCHNCGAALVGAAVFCGACGAKQPTAVPAAPAPTPAPAPAPAPVAAPVAAPANSLAAPKKLGMSVPALILGIAALMATGLAFLLQFIFVSLQRSYKFDLQLLWPYLRHRGVVTGLLTSGIVPIVAILVTIIKKKPVALVGLILTAVCMMFQLIVMLLYGRLVSGRAPLGILRMVSVLSNWINGEGLLYNLWRNIRMGITGLRAYWNANMVSMGLYWLKNILALVACLLVAVKKKK